MRSAKDQRQVHILLRPLRGLNKEHLSHYIAVHEWASNLKHVTDDFLRAMMWRFTFKPT